MTQPIDVLVIGAGPAGIVSAYYLQKAGISYQVVDSANVIASTWANLYPSLRLNTTRFFSHMPGKRFPLHYGFFPTARQYHRYLVEFVREHNLNIQLGVTVERIRPQDDGWCVEFSQEGRVIESRWYPVVISAAGRFANPYTAAIPGLAEYGGRVIHAHEYHGVEPFIDQQVMVIGNGPSGLDISIEIGKANGVKNPALLAMRTGITLKPRYPLGLPKHAWMLLTERLPRRLGKWLDTKIEAIQYRNLDRIGIKVPQQGQESGAASTRGPELINAVKAGYVVCVDGPKRFTRDTLELMDGSVYQPDAVIIATGYRPVVHYLRDLPYTTGDQDWPLRDFGMDYDIDYAALDYKGTYSVGAETDIQKGVLPRELKGYPGLYFVGIFYKGKGTLYNVNVEAEIAAAQIKQRLQSLKLKKQSIVNR